MAITPYLLYEDVGGALKFLAKAFGLRRYGRPMKNADGVINHAAMQLGRDVVMMGYPGPEYRNPRRLGQATIQLYVNVDDVDKHYRRAKKAGAKIIEAARYHAAPAGAVLKSEGHPWYFARAIRRPPPGERAGADGAPVAVLLRVRSLCASGVLSGADAVGLSKLCCPASPVRPVARRLRP
jgi:uncharacterized glyoxalase superfamily protein PhnB